MYLVISKMKEEHWKQVSEIYLEGIKTDIATFEADVPTWEGWDKTHIKECRLVAFSDNELVGWAALSKVSNRYVYRGVAEVSIYIKAKSKGKKVGTNLLNALIAESEKQGFWTLQSGIFEENTASVNLHKKCGFRVVGLREKIGKTSSGEWKNLCFMERRSGKTR